MDIKKRLLIGIMCLAAWMTAGTVWAGEGQVSDSGNGGQTDILAGVIVEYMGKLRFEVYQQGTTIPIEGASVELYIPSLGRHVLLGMTDANGVYELEYSLDTPADPDSQFQTVDGALIFQGTLLYLSSSEIQYQIYKSGWYPYPYQGMEILSGHEVPCVITVYLYQESVEPTTSGGSGNGGSGSSGSGSSGTGSTSDGGASTDDAITIINDPFPGAGLNEGENAGGIPRTGVEGAIPYWIAGALFFLLAGGILLFLWKNGTGNKENEERCENE